MKKTWLISAILFGAMALTACVPVAVVAAATAAGTVAYDNRSISQQLTDNDIITTAQDRLLNDQDLANHSQIYVDAFDGVVLMIGQAQSQMWRTRAYNLIATIPHVKKVYNEVTISGGQSDISTANDSLLSAKVKAALVGGNGLSNANLKSVVADGVVYLMGTVTRMQADTAVNLARKVSGVRKVVRVFSYKN